MAGHSSFYKLCPVILFNLTLYFLSDTLKTDRHMKHSTKVLYLIPLGLFPLLIALAPTTFAVNGSNNGSNRVRESTDTPSKWEERKQQTIDRLTETKLKVCQSKETAIKNRAIHMGDLANTMIGKFDSITTRVETYYTSKVIPSGKTVANYDSLVTDIQTKKDAVQTALTQAQASANSFTCDSNNPREQALQFRNDIKEVISALKEYRTSIKNLIIAVRSINSQGGNQ